MGFFSALHHLCVGGGRGSQELCKHCSVMVESSPGLSSSSPSPSRSQLFPSGSQLLPSGSQLFPSRSALPSGSQLLPSGSALPLWVSALPLRHEHRYTGLAWLIWNAPEEEKRVAVSKFANSLCIAGRVLLTRLRRLQLLEP